MKGKKILGGLVLGSLLVIGITLGALKVTGFFKDAETEAMNLLAQLPDKLSSSYEEEFLGISALKKNSRDKGSVTTLHVSGVKVNKEMAQNVCGELPGTKNVALVLQALQDCVGTVDIQTDTGRNHKISGVLNKGNARLSADLYADGETLQYALPEIFPGRVIVQEQNTSVNTDEEQQKKKMMNFILQEYEKTKEEITCKKSRESAETYQFIFSSKTLSLWIKDFLSFLGKEEKLVTLTKQLSEESSEYVFCVKGSEGKLTSLSLVAQDRKGVFPVEITLSLSEEEQSNTVKLIYEEKGESKNRKCEITKQNRKTDVYETSLKVMIQTDSTSMNVDMTRIMDPNDHSYNLDAVLKWHGTKVAELVMEGAVKDIIPGESVHYIWDDITLNVGGKKCVTLSVDLQKKLLDYKFEKPEGEEVKFAEMTTEMKQEIQANKTKKMLEFGFDKIFLDDVLSKALQ